VERKEYYDDIYLNRDPVGFEENVAVPIKTKIILSLLKERKNTPSQKILELGCGEGYVARIIEKNLQPSLLIGQDISFRALESARTVIKEGLFIQCEAECLPVRDNCLDLILLVDVLEHLLNPALVLKEALRLSRSLLVKVPLEKNVWGWSFKWGVEPLIRTIQGILKGRKRNNGNFFNPHIHLFSEKDITSIINVAGGRVMVRKKTGYPWDADYDEALEKVKIEMHRELGLIKSFPRYYILFNRFPLPELRMFVKRCIGKISPFLYYRCFHTHLYLLVEREKEAVN